MSPLNQNKSHHDVDVIIVGAGPTGLMMAALLARCGVTVRIFDKSDQQAHETRAFGIQAKSLELFLNLGIIDKFLDRGIFTNGAQIFIDGKQAAELNFDDIGRDDTPYSFLLMVPQYEIEAILVDDLKRFGIAVENQIEVVDFEQSSDQVIVSAINLKNNNSLEVSGKYLVGADGAHSIVRKKLGLTFEGGAYASGFLLADCKITWPFDYEHMKVFLRGQHLAVYLPLKGKDICRLITIKSLSTDDKTTSEIKTSEELTLDEIQQEFNAATGEDYRLSDAQWLSRYHIHHRGVNKYAINRAFVAGDAAHIHSPAGGQGMNTGLQDVANLAWKLAVVIKGNTSTKLLDTYHLERWPVGQKILNFTDKLFVGMSSQKPFSAWLRNTIVPIFANIVSKSKYCRRKAFNFISQLGIRYHKNEFIDDYLTQNATQSWRNGLIPGRRAPNANIARNLDVFSLIQGYQFHLLVISKKPLTTFEIDKISQDISQLPKAIGMPLQSHLISASLLGRNENIIHAESNQIFETYGLSKKTPQAIFLIRPDGYIAYRSNILDFDKLRDFFIKLK